MGTRGRAVGAAQAREFDAGIGRQAVGRARVMGVEVEECAEESGDDDEQDGTRFSQYTKFLSILFLPYVFPPKSDCILAIA